jgi:chain length determinant protein (polysaccharide antigen chain regulator)
MSHAESLPSHRPIPASFNTQEIDLGELFTVLWRQKYLIAGIAMAVAAMSAVYAYTATPQYQTKTLLRPPTIKDLDALNQTGVYTLSTEESLRRIGAALNSYEVRKTYFDKHQEQFTGIGSGDVTQSFERFNSEAFRLLQSNPKDGDNLATFVGLEITYPETVEGHFILNGIVQEAIKSERKRIQDDLDGVIDNSLTTLERKMATARASYEADKESTIAKLSESDALKRARLQDELRAVRTELRDRRESRITQLNESIQIARELGIVKPTTPTAMGRGDGASQGNVFRTEVFNEQFPLHFMGSEALGAERNALLARKSDDHTSLRISEIKKELQLLDQNREIEQLKSRKNDDLFLATLVDMRAEKTRLEHISRDLNELTLVKVDQQAIKPSKPIKPNKLLILALGIIGGGMLGIFVALIRGVVLSRSAGRFEVSSEKVLTRQSILQEASRGHIA